jgi:hypothetical protein
MANTTSASLKLTVQATGENSGTWGQITNTNLLILEQAIGGYQSVGITSAATLTFSNGALSNGKNQVIKLTGNITGNKNVVIPDSGLGTAPTKTYTVENATTGAFTVTFKTSSGTGITWSTTDKGKKILYSDGTNVLEGISSVGDLVAGDVTTNTITTNTINVSNITISASTTANTISASGDVTTSAGNMSDQKGEVRTVPRLDKTASHTLTLSDHGKFIRTDSNITVPVGVFTESDAGKSISIYNKDPSSTISITRASGAVMYWVQTGANEDRTLNSRGLATLLCVGNNTFVITGGLLS